MRGVGHARETSCEVKQRSTKVCDGGVFNAD